MYLLNLLDGRSLYKHSLQTVRKPTNVNVCIHYALNTNMLRAPNTKQ